MRMTVTQIANPDYHGAIHVVNKSSGPLRGNVVFNVADEGTKQPVPVRVPDTFLAVDLLEMATKKQITESQDFRQSLNRGLLVLIDETEALEINSRPGSRQERERLRKSRELVEVMQSASYGSASEATPLPQSAPVPAAGDVVGSRDLEGIHPRLWGLDAKIGENGEVGVINIMRAVVDELSLKDLRYALGLAKAGNHRKLGSYASSQLRKRKGLPPRKGKRKAKAAA